MLMGRTLSSSSIRAMSIGDLDDCDTSMRTGAPIDICRALAPTTRALSNLVSFFGPINWLCLDLEELTAVSPVDSLMRGALWCL